MFVQRVHFGCSRCGACCNSTPQMSLPELFRHQTRFVGCLSTRRLAEPPAGIDARALADLHAFFSRYAQRSTSRGAGYYVLLTAQAYGDPLAAACPALSADKLCTLQDNGKPLACRVVPLEATQPDLFQLSILQGRAREAEYMGADCIQLRSGPEPVVETARNGSTVPRQLPVLVEGPRILEPEARRALELRRASLFRDRLHWGDRVFELLRHDLFEHPERVPEQGYLCLPLAPALSVISAFSNALTRRVVEYLTAQIELIALTLGAPVKEPTQAHRELAGMLRVNLNLRTKLQSARPLPEPQPNATEVEAWLAGQGLEASVG